MSKGVDSGRVEGWVEVIVRDKDGKVKYRLGGPPPEFEVGEEGDCAVASMLSPSMPAKLTDYYWRKNVITNVGLAAIIRLVFSGLTEDKFGYIAIGTGTTAEAVTDTALVAEIKRKTATVTQTTTSVTGDTALLEATFSSADGLTGTSNVAEAGIFNAATGGILLARKTFSAVPVNWDAGDSITIRYYVQLTR
jgi:hypothetical protein